MNKDLKNVLIIGGIIVALLIVVSMVGGFLGWQGSGMMGGFGWGGLMGIGAVVMIVFWGLVIWGIILLVRGLASGTGWGESPRQDSALEILKRRYARGEINKEDFEAKKKDLL